MNKASEEISIDVIDSWERGYGKGHDVYEKGTLHPPSGTYRFFYWLAQHESAYRTCCQILKMYHFREGLEFTNQNRFEEQVRRLNEMFKKVNGNYQTFLQVLFEIEDDLNIVDDAFLCFSRSYVLNRDSGEILYSDIKEIYRGNPLYYRFVSSDNTRIGGVYGRCLVCEAMMAKDKDYRSLTKRMGSVSYLSNQAVFRYTEEMFNYSDGNYRCPVCNAMLHDVEFVVTDYPDTDEAIFYHIKGEVIHMSKYNISRLYGLSPIVTLSNQIDVRIRLTQYLESFLEYNRAPQGAIFINSNNPSQIKNVLEKAQSKYMEDRYYMPIIAVDSEKSGGNFVQYVKFTPLPEELKMQDSLNHLKREICAMLGVQNVMVNDLEGVGGLNSESLQVQVTDRAALAGQMVYNDVLFPRLMEALGEYGQFDIPDDLKLIVRRTDNAENDTRLANLEREMNLALTIQDMGYEVTPDFTNLLGYDNKKLLPFSFRKLSKREIMEQQNIGMMDRDDKVKSPSTPTRPKIPGFRTKEFVSKEFVELRDNLIKYNEIRVIGGEIFYKIFFNPYEYDYVDEKTFKKYKDLKDKKEVEKMREEENLNKLREEAIEKPKINRDLLSAISFMKDLYSDPMDIIENAIDMIVM